jgi:hypothetical protein
LADEKATLLDFLTKAVLDLISTVPTTNEPRADDPGARCRSIANTAAAKAAVVSGGLSLPPGPLGMLTILPDLITIWKIQSQMVADIAGAFGKKVMLTREQMLYCLFKHAASQAVRDLVIRVGERVIVRRPTFLILQNILRKIGIGITQRVAGKTLGRWLPVIGAIGIGAYAYYDTAQVGLTTIKLFKEEIEVEPEKGENPTTV